MTMTITMRNARMRMKMTIMRAITMRTKRTTMKTWRTMITVVMAFIPRQQLKTLKTCWTGRTPAKEAISLVTHLILNPLTHTHALWKTTQESTMRNTSSKPERTCGGD